MHKHSRRIIHILTTDVQIYTQRRHLDTNTSSGCMENPADI